VPPSPDAQQGTSLRILEVPAEPVKTISSPSKSQPETITTLEPGATEKSAAPQFLPSAGKIGGLPLARKSFERRPMNRRGWRPDYVVWSSNARLKEVLRRGQPPAKRIAENSMAAHT
jgi:hypothetical protein